MTDPETANRTYIGPMTPELVETIIAKARAQQVTPPPLTPPQEKPDALLPTMGGQTALNLAVTLAEARRAPTNTPKTRLTPSGRSRAC